MKKIVVVFMIMLVIAVSGPILAWNDTVRSALIEDVLKSIAPERSLIMENQTASLLPDVSRGSSPQKVTGYYQSAYRLNLEMAELYRLFGDEPAYFEKLGGILNQVIELFDPFVVTRDRGLYKEQDQEFHNSLADLLADIRVQQMNPSFATYSTPWMTPSLGMQSMVHPFAAQSSVSEAVKIAELRGKRVLALYLRGYNVYDLRGELSGLYAETVRSVARVLDSLVSQYQIRTRVYTGAASGNQLEVKIGDWYKENAALRGSTVVNLRGFGAVAFKQSKDQQREEAIENALRMALETEAVRNSLKNMFKVSDKDLNLSGIEVKVKAGALTAQPHPQSGYPMQAYPQSGYPMPYYDQSPYGQSPYGYYGYQPDPYQYSNPVVPGTSPAGPGANPYSQNYYGMYNQPGMAPYDYGMYDQSGMNQVVPGTYPPAAGAYPAGPGAYPYDMYGGQYYQGYNPYAGGQGYGMYYDPYAAGMYGNQYYYPY